MSEGTARAPGQEQEPDPRRLHWQTVRAARRARASHTPPAPPRNFADAALRQAFPHSAVTYPGRRRSILVLIGRAKSWAAVQHWQSGRHPLPDYAAIALRDLLRQRGRADLEMADRLDAHLAQLAARIKPITGCFAVGPNGQSGRGFGQIARNPVRAARSSPPPGADPPNKSPSGVASEAPPLPGVDPMAG